MRVHSHAHSPICSDKPNDSVTAQGAAAEQGKAGKVPEVESKASDMELSENE